MLTVFVDESCADGNNRFLIHGALFVKEDAISPMREHISEICRESGIRDELKWTNITRRSLARDMNATDVFFFDRCRPDGCTPPRFQCMVVDQHRVNARHFHGGDRDLCFYKLLYQLLLKRVQEYASRDEAVHIVLDHRSIRRYNLGDLRTVLRNGLRKNLGEDSPDVRSVVYADSRSDPLLQLSDVLAGAVGFYQNGHARRAGASQAKLDAASLISRKAGLISLSVENRYDTRFGIWTIRLRAP